MRLVPVEGGPHAIPWTRADRELLAFIATSTAGARKGAKNFARILRVFAPLREILRYDSLALRRAALQLPPRGSTRSLRSRADASQSGPHYPRLSSPEESP